MTNKKSHTPHKQQAAVATLVRSPSAQTPRKSNRRGYHVPVHPTPQRMHHNIPHRFVTGLNTRATKCGLCLGSVHFVKQASKCQGETPCLLFLLLSVREMGNSSVTGCVRHQSISSCCFELETERLCAFVLGATCSLPAVCEREEDYVCVWHYISSSAVVCEREGRGARGWKEREKKKRRERECRTLCLWFLLFVREMKTMCLCVA